ncbi:MAG: PAS domain S-box protein [Anaerolineales bacterium]|nr:PAS domain S-box protein [Anaerolineales bacterium]
MTWHFTPYSVPLIIGAVVLFISAFLVLRRSPTLANIYMAIVNILIAIFSGGYGMELGQTTFEGIYFWQKVGFIGGVASPVFLLLLIIAYNGPERWLTGVNHLLLMAIPAVSIGFAWTNQYHGLIWDNPRLVQAGTLLLFDYDPGWWHQWVTMIYTLIMVILSVAVLLFSFFRREGAFRKQVLLILVGISFPMLAYGFFWASIAMGLSLPKISWQAYALIITGLMMTVSLHNYQVFQIGPVAYDAIFKNIEDVIVVLDGHNRVIDVNPNAINILKWERPAVIGKNLLELLSSPDLEALQPYLNVSDSQGEIVLGDYHLDLKITSFKYQLQKSVGRLMVMRDISQRVEAENAMRKLATLDERHRLASDLHDSMTQSLHSLILSAETAQHLHQEEQYEKLTDSLAMLEDSARQALQEMRLLLHELELTPEEHIDPLELLEARLGSVERRTGIETDLRINNLGVIPKIWKREIFFIIVEALNNALRHSRGDRIWVSIQGTPYQVAVEVRDNGRGFDLNQVEYEGMGLRNISERAARMGGVLMIDSAPRHGTTISLKIDLDNTSVNSPIK